MNIIEGDVFKCEEDLIVHQVNCRGVMGSGIAREVRNRFPDVYNRYKDDCWKYGSRCLGAFSCVPISTSKGIVNLYGQDGFGVDKCYTDYKAVKRAFRLLAMFAKKNNFSIAIPYYIGCNRGGGDWDIYSAIIEKELNGINYTIYRKY